LPKTVGAVRRNRREPTEEMQILMYL